MTLNVLVQVWVTTSKTELMIFSTTNLMYELPLKLPNDLKKKKRLRTLGDSPVSSLPEIKPRQYQPKNTEKRIPNAPFTAQFPWTPLPWPNIPPGTVHPLNPFQFSAAFHEETNYLFCYANQMTGLIWSLYEPQHWVEMG